MSHISAFPSAWVARFADLPLFPGRSIITEHDGDMAWLDHLIESVLEDPPAQIVCPPRDYIWRQTITATGINPAYIEWGDQAWVALNDWRCQR